MTTPPGDAPRALHEEQESLWALLLLQSAAVRERAKEFHQQVEFFVQQTGEHPLTGQRNVRAAHETLAVRERTTPAVVAPLPLVSDAMVALARELCTLTATARDVAAMTQLTKKIEDAALSIDDKAQVLFVLDASFRVPETPLLSAFDKAGGYGTLMAWFEGACGFADESNKALAKLLLQFLGTHKPALPFSRKTVLTRLRGAQSMAVGRYNKLTIKEMIEKYREQ